MKSPRHARDATIRYARTSSSFVRRTLAEFREFAMKGNVIDLAVGIIIGGGFNKIVSSLVNDIVMPPVGFVTHGEGFKELRWVLAPATPTDPAVSVNYGVFLQTLIEFLIVAVAVFFLVKLINAMRRREETKPTPPPPTPAREEQLLTEIRDLLQASVKRGR